MNPPIDYEYDTFGLERKTFFAIISLLIDPQLVNAEEIITEDNYEQFIPQEHSALIEKLKR